MVSATTGPSYSEAGTRRGCAARRRGVRRALGALAVAALATGPLVSCASATGGDGEATARVDGDAVELFDPSVVHEIAVEFEAADYDDLIATYAESGEKAWMEATVTVDGVTYERAGLRLKGNSSLMGLGRSVESGEATTGTTEEATTDAKAGDTTGDTTGGARAPGGGFPGGGMGPAGGGLTADAPEDLPWLIRLDHFVDDQRHQGYADIVVRSNNSTTSLNEAVALDLLDAAGLASQLAVSTSFAVNGGEPVLRLAIEHPDDDAWQDRSFSAPGALYKAESTGDWSYRGDDPAAYEDVFDQEGGKQVADLTPLIDLLRFLDESDDETFAAELPERLDVDAFATYLALMDLVQNFDDIDGPGRNAYLWWDEASGQFTIVPWDLNLAFGAMGGGQGGRPGGFGPGQIPEGFDPAQIPEGFDPAQIPEGSRPAGGPGDGAAGGGMFGGGNVLVERFHANEEFEALYREKLVHFRTELFASGESGSLLDTRAEVLREVSDLVTADVVDEEAGRLRDAIATSAEG